MIVTSSVQQCRAQITNNHHIGVSHKCNSWAMNYVNELHRAQITNNHHIGVSYKCNSWAMNHVNEPGCHTMQNTKPYSCSSHPFSFCPHAFHIPLTDTLPKPNPSFIHILFHFIGFFSNNFFLSTIMWVTEPHFERCKPFQLHVA